MRTSLRRLGVGRFLSRHLSTPPRSGYPQIMDALPVAPRSAGMMRSHQAEGVSLSSRSNPMSSSSLRAHSPRPDRRYAAVANPVGLLGGVGASSGLCIALVRPWEQKRFSRTGSRPGAHGSGQSATKAAGGAKPGADGLHDDTEPKATVAEAFTFMLPHLWPKGRTDHKIRIVVSLACVFGAKVFLIAVPFYFKGIIDALVKTSCPPPPPGAAAAGSSKSGAAAAASSSEGHMAFDPANSEGAADAGDEAGEVAAEIASTAVTAIASEQGNTFAVQLAMDVASTVFGTGVFALVAAYGATRMASIFASEMRTAVFSRVSADAYTNINESIFLKLHGLELNYHLSKKTGVITKVLDRGSRAFSSMAWCTMFVICPTIFEMSVVSVLLKQQVGVEFVAIALVAIVLYAVWTTHITNWRLKFRDAYNEQESRNSSLVVDSLLNYETVKYFSNEAYEAKRLRTANETMNEFVVRLDQSMSLLNFGQQAIFVAAATTSIYFASTGVLAGTMSVGDLVLVDALLLQLYTPMSWLGIVYREMTTSTQNMQAMLGLLNRPSLMVDRPDAVEFKYNVGEITFDHASFKYGGKSVLNDVSVTIPGGSLAAFVGPSGSGKTTIFRLLFRFLNLDSGRILIDGQDISGVTMASLRKDIGVIPQDTVMFNDSVAYNIEYGKLGSSMDAIQNAAKQAAVHDAISSFAAGYDSVVGERGLKLSGGEKQRVAIARVLLQNPKIILADEATSALDTHTEASVVETLRQSSEGGQRTVIMIAHRLATVRNCDVIFVLNAQGQITEVGSHEELLEREGLYHDLWTEQQAAKKHSPQLHSSAAAEAANSPPPPASTGTPAAQ